MHAVPSDSTSTSDGSGFAVLATSVFYSSASVAVLKRRAQAAYLPSQAPVNRSSQLATFARQQEAFDFADGQPQPQAVDTQGVRLAPAICSFESPGTGTRRFGVAARWDDVYAVVSAAAPDRRHFYELLREGKPLNGYLDLEFEKNVANEGIDEDALARTTLNSLRAAIRERYGLDMQHDGILELISSNSTKASRHLIVRLPGGAAFADGTHLGRFINWWAARIAADADNGNDAAAALFVMKNDGTRSFFVDKSVYSRNRVLRLYGSCKFGKSAVLEPSMRTARRYCQPISGCLSRDLFLDCLASLVMPGGALLTFDNDIDRAPATRRLASVGYKSTSGPSLCPAADRHVAQLGTYNSTVGVVRSWTFFNASATLVYAMKASRFCARIGREHRSNGVYFVFDFRAGTSSQRCFDHECAGFRRTAQLPEEVTRDFAEICAAAADEEEGRDDDARTSDVIKDNFVDGARAN